VKLHASGGKVGELCRQHGSSEATLYHWRVKYGAMTVSEARGLKVLEAENRKL
jgi:putative transposase